MDRFLWCNRLTRYPFKVESPGSSPGGNANMDDTVRFFMPDVGTDIVLAADWRFALHAHPRNRSLGEALGFWREGWTDAYLLAERRWAGIPARRVFVPEGTRLRLKWVEMGRRNLGFSCVGFGILKGCCRDARLCGTRFWTPLGDANRIVCERPEGDGAEAMGEADIADSRWELLE